MPFSEAIFLRQKKKKKSKGKKILVATRAAQSVKDALNLMLGLAECVVLFQLCRFHFEYLPGFFLKILLQPSQQK